MKAPVYQTGHPATSDPIDEQNWLVNEVNSIEQLPTWNSTAIFVTYDDSDGWYDHVYSGVTNPSKGTADTLTGRGRLRHRADRARPPSRCTTSKADADMAPAFRSLSSRPGRSRTT